MTAAGPPPTEDEPSELPRSRRAANGPEPVREGVAIAGPGGDFEAVDRAFASRFGYARGQLLGDPWRDLFAADEVDRLESTAVPTVEDGWRWVGTCGCRRSDGKRIAVRLRIVELDGKLAFVARIGGTRRNGGDASG